MSRLSPRALNRRLSLRLKLGLAFGAVAVVAVLSLTPQAAARLGQSIEAAHASNLATADLLARQAADQILEIENELSMIAADRALVGAYLAGDLAHVEARLEDTNGVDPDIITISLIDQQGRVRATSLRDKSGVGGDASQQSQFQVALRDGQPSFGDARIGSLTGEPIVPVAVPLRGPDRRTVAVLQGTLSLRRLSDRLAGTKIGTAGYASLLDSRGIILTHPDKSRILLRTAEAPEVQQALSGNRAALATTDRAGDAVFAAAVPAPDIGWVVHVQVPRDEIYAPLRQDLRRVASIAALGFVLAVLVGVVLARRLTEPILSLRNRMRRIAAPHMGEMQVEDGGDEIIDLDLTFGAMAGALREAMTLLRTRAAEAERQRAMATAVLDGVEEAVLFFDTDLRLVLANSRLRLVMGLDPTQVVGRRLSELRRELRSTLADPHAFLRWIHDGGASRDDVDSAAFNTCATPPSELAAYSAPVRDGAGGFIGRIYVFRDVTREREVDRMKTEFVSLVSHELRTPLTSIKGYVDLLVEGEAGAITPEQSDFLQVVRTNADRLVGLINDLLDISRIEAGKIELQRAPVDLVALLQSVALAFRPQVEARRQELTLDLPPDLPRVWGDVGRITQIANNLVSNAHKYTLENGRITVSAAVAGDTVRVSISDTGVGLTPEQQARLFERFFRADNRVTRSVAGTGLGLSITRALVQMHGGDISVASEAGRGSTFAFTLPLMGSASAPDYEREAIA
jgi:signal transduction histidine kinase